MWILSVEVLKLLDDTIDAKIDSEVKASAEQQAGGPENILVHIALADAFIAFVRLKTQDVMDTHFGYKFSSLLGQCFGSNDIRKQIHTQQAITSTLHDIYHANSAGFSTYMEQIKLYVLSVSKHADVLTDLNLKCSILQLTNDIQLRMQAILMPPNEKRPISDLTYNVFVEFLTDNRVEINIPQFSKLYQISDLNYRNCIKAMLAQCHEEQYVYQLTMEKINELASVLLKKSFISIEEEASEPHPISAVTLNLRSTSMFSKEEINDFCGRIKVATQRLKTPAETVFPATEWNRRIGVLKGNLSRLQTTISNLISRPPVDQKAFTDALTLANKALETQIFNEWLKIAHNRGLTDSSYTDMFALVAEWKQKMSDQYWEQSAELGEMTARCARAEARVTELTSMIEKAGEINGRYKEKSRQVVRLNTQVTEAVEKAAMVKADCAVYLRTSVSILHDTTLTDAEKIRRLATLHGRSSEFPQNQASIAQRNKQKKEESEDELSEAEIDASSSSSAIPTFTPKYQTSTPTTAPNPLQSSINGSTTRTSNGGTKHVG